MTKRYWVLANDRTGEPRQLLRTGAGGILRDRIDRWDPETGMWDRASGHLEGRLKGLGGDADDPDEIAEADVYAVQVALMERDAQASSIEAAIRHVEDAPVSPDGMPSPEEADPRDAFTRFALEDREAAEKAGEPYANDWAIEDPWDTNERKDIDR